MPIIDARTKIKIDKKPLSYLFIAKNPTKIFLMIVKTGLSKNVSNLPIWLNPGFEIMLRVISLVELRVELTPPSVFKKIF